MVDKYFMLPMPMVRIRQSFVVVVVVRLLVCAVRWWRLSPSATCYCWVSTLLCSRLNVFSFSLVFNAYTFCFRSCNSWKFLMGYYGLISFLFSSSSYIFHYYYCEMRMQTHTCARTSQFQLIKLEYSKMCTNFIVANERATVYYWSVYAISRLMQKLYPNPVLYAIVPQQINHSMFNSCNHKVIIQTDHSFQRKVICLWWGSTKSIIHIFSLIFFLW